MILLDPEELAQLLPAETHSYPGPIPTQSVSSDEFMPAPQTDRQRRVQARIKKLGGALARKHGMTRRQFLATASGMAAAFLAMNEVYGPLYGVSPVGETNARLYRYTPEWRAALPTDRIAALKAEYEQAGGLRSNLRYGYVCAPQGVAGLGPRRPGRADANVRPRA